LALVRGATPSNRDVLVSCNRDSLTIRVPTRGLSDPPTIDKWSRLPGCQFYNTTQGFYELSLPLTEGDIRSCGLTKVTNIEKGSSLYYQRLSLPTTTGGSAPEPLLVKCVPRADARELQHNIIRRDLPPNFREPEFIEITSEVTGSAPAPVLGVGVKQDNSLVQGAINVAPGTPLTMEVYLDGESAGTYGILVSYLDVTDNTEKKENIIYNGCTVDKNLFENFETVSGDTLTASFRAFKFPGSNFVLFTGTVDVCLDKCQGITCSDGQIGFGRRRRAVAGGQHDSNKLYQVTMSTIIYFTEGEAGPVAEEEIIASEVFEGGESEGGMPAAIWENPLVRESPDSPPSVRFSHSHSPSRTYSASLPLLILAVLTTFCVGTQF